MNVENLKFENRYLEYFTTAPGADTVNYALILSFITNSL